MYYNRVYYPAYPTVPPYPAYVAPQPIPRTYPPVDTKIFASSIKSFHLLMEQGSILLDRLGDEGFAHKMMMAAQQGKHVEVDHLIKSIDLKVPVTTKFTPTGVNFMLTSQTSHHVPVSCCTLTISMKWGY